LVRSQNGEFFDITAVLVAGTPASGLAPERRKLPGDAALKLRDIFDLCQATNDRDKPEEEAEGADGDNNDLDGGQGGGLEDVGGPQEAGGLEDGDLEDGGSNLIVGVVTRRAARLRGAGELRGLLR
jgi:hypothetical protein